MVLTLGRCEQVGPRHASCRRFNNRAQIAGSMTQFFETLQGRRIVHDLTDDGGGADVFWAVLKPFANRFAVGFNVSITSFKQRSLL